MRNTKEHKQVETALNGIESMLDREIERLRNREENCSSSDAQFAALERRNALETVREKLYKLQAEVFAFETEYFI